MALAQRTETEPIRRRKLASGAKKQGQGFRRGPVAATGGTHWTCGDPCPEQASDRVIDPLGFNAGDSNLYRYVKNSPALASDPTGLDELIDQNGYAIWVTQGVGQVPLGKIVEYNFGGGPPRTVKMFGDFAGPTETDPYAYLEQWVNKVDLRKTDSRALRDTVKLVLKDYQYPPGLYGYWGDKTAETIGSEILDTLKGFGRHAAKELLIQTAVVVLAPGFDKAFGVFLHHAGAGTKSIYRYFNGKLFTQVEGKLLSVADDQASILVKKFNKEFGTSAQVNRIRFNSGGGERIGPVFDPAQLERILENLQIRGVSVQRGPDAERYLDFLGANASYMATQGEAGILTFRSSATRMEVVEELIHHGQAVRRQFQLPQGVRVDLFQAQMEVEAQQTLIRISERLQWTKAENAQLHKALDYWRGELQRIQASL